MRGPPSTRFCRSHSRPRALPPGFRLVGRNDGCGGRRQLGSAGRTVDPAPSLLDSGSWAGMTNAGAAVNSVLPGRTVDPAPSLLDSGSWAGMTDVEAAVNSVLPGRTVDPAPSLLDSGSWAGMTNAGAAVNSVLPGRTVDPAPSLLDSGSWAGMTDAGAAVNSVLPVAQSTRALPPGFRLVGRNDGCGGCRQLGSAGRAVDPRPPSWIPARGPE